MALPLLFMAGTSIVRAATPAIARYLVSQGLKKATGAAAKKPVSSVITTVKQAKNLKPSTKVVGKKLDTKVVGKKPTASTVSSAPKANTTGSTPKPLRADPNKRISKAAPKKTPKDTGLKSAGTLASTASLAAMLPRGESKTAKADNKTNNRPKRTAAQKEAMEKRLKADSRRATAQKVADRTKEAVKAKQGDAKKYNVGVSRGGVPFDEAFGYHRKKGVSTFMWNDKKYTTKLAKKGKK